MRKILVVTTIDRTIRAFLLPHIKHLQANNYKVELATNITDQNIKKEIKETLGDVTIYPIPFQRRVFSILNLKAYFLVKRLIKNHYELIHVHTPIASFITRLASSKSQKVIYTAHGFHFNEYGSRLTNILFWLAEKLAGYRTSKLIVINKDDMLKAQRIVPSHKIEYIKGVGIDTDQYNPAKFTEDDKQLFKSLLTIPQEFKVITHIAEFNNNKRQIDVVRACESIKQEYDNFIILLIGTGSTLSYIKQEIKNRDLEKHIKCLGYRNDIDQILSITDIGLLPSLREGLPRSVMEMMAMQVPVIITDIRGNRDLVKDGYNGFLVPVKSPEIIAKRCLELMNDEKLSKKFIRRSYQKIHCEFSLDKVLEKQDSVYLRILKAES